jgi:uncharacterized membrane protein YsdA (DUF1294 family)/cold shock CspA family protein
MRLQGRVINWKDERGFGFVIPNGGGQKAFVHMKAFSDSLHRPKEGDIITYELASDERGRFFAKEIRYAKNNTSSIKSNKFSSFSNIFVCLFILILVFLVLLGQLPQAILVLYTITSIITFLFYAIDKSAAQNGRWRTKESTLHLLGLFGGWPGALFAQKTLRHKSKKQAFQTFFWITVITNCCILGWMLVTKSGSNFLNFILS